ncbi:MAG: selenocysteine-specific translation elongation factor, partial [Noviherbaspirillum sp.]
MIVATAGHVDHGKTTLVRALTGVDTDRLPEEKRRGMSIDIGFAYADLGGPQPVGFVDVPGHERFLRNMLAGVAAVDFALLVVAADDGVMPQTCEHLAVLDLLGVRLGAVALTKADRVDQGRMAAVGAEVRALLAATALRDAPLFEIAASTGAGVDTLRQHLAAAQRGLAERSAAGNFRLAVDRSFTLPGAGLVVTGAVLAGSVRTGDALLLSPAGLPVRVRSIHAQDRPVDAAGAGMRCALNLAGDLRRVEAGRGDWIVAAAAHAPTQRIDVRLRLLPEAAELAHWTPVQLHLGAASASAHVALLEGRTLEPGMVAYAQLVLERAVAALHGDRFILRSQAGQRVIGGGVVVDPDAGSRRVARPQRLARLAALDRTDAGEALAALLRAEPTGSALDEFMRGRNLDAAQAAALRQSVPMQEAGALALGLERWQALQACALEEVSDWHLQHPDSLGLPETALAACLRGRALPPLARAAIRALLEQGALVRDSLLLRLPSHCAQLAPQDSALLAQMVALLEPAGLRPPIVGELAAALGLERAAAMAFLERLSRLGYLEQVAPNRYFLPRTVAALAAIAAELAARSDTGEFDASSYRNRSGIGRNLT